MILANVIRAAVAGLSAMGRPAVPAATVEPPAIVHSERDFENRDAQAEARKNVDLGLVSLQYWRPLTPEERAISTASYNEFVETSERRVMKELRAEGKLPRAPSKAR